MSETYQKLIELIELGIHVEIETKFLGFVWAHGKSDPERRFIWTSNNCTNKCPFGGLRTAEECVENLVFHLLLDKDRASKADLEKLFQESLKETGALN